MAELSAIFDHGAGLAAGHDDQGDRIAGGGKSTDMSEYSRQRPHQRFVFLSFNARSDGEDR